MKTDSRKAAILFIGVICFVCCQTSHAQNSEKESRRQLSKSFSSKEVDWRKSQKININNISTWIHWNGESDIDRTTNDAGFEFPKGSNKYCFYQSGLIWGGKVGDEIRVGGSKYSSSLTPGWIEVNGTPVDENDERVRIYKTRSNYMTADLTDEAKDEQRTVEEIRAQYIKDSEEWHTELGAPYQDINGDGIFTPNLDKIGIPAADQTLWFVALDTDEDLSQLAFNCKPTGIELQTSVWGYDANFPYNNMIFKRYVLINKSSDTIKDMYIGMWSDPDIGWATDDFVGCNTVLNLGYGYNDETKDEVYGFEVPAVGFQLIQGPKKNDRTKYFDMTSFAFFISEYCPDTFEPPDKANVFLYNSLQGLIDCTGSPFINPLTHDTTKYALSGNPLNKTGWIDGIINKSGDRRMLISSGPFNMEPGDTQEVIYAQIAAQGTDRLASILWLIRAAFTSQCLCYEPTKPALNVTLPEYFYLSQNYPNPFNPVTKIIYEIPIDCHVTLKVYDLLGKEIATLVNEYKQAGQYSVEFRVKSGELSSGIYFYSIQAGQYFKYRKMILAK
ncbi:MAG: T9SS type A sorting domain-containing protein [Ignavibacteriales bacterium]|nr:T9SS type A sorting domain-containing protein [Ignavibacteriales bacterium]